MARNNLFLRVAEHASDALRSSGALRRVDDDGYIRIDPFQVATSAGVPVVLRRLDKLLGCWRRRQIDPVAEISLTRADSSRPLILLDLY